MPIKQYTGTQHGYDTGPYPEGLTGYANIHRPLWVERVAIPLPVNPMLEVIASRRTEKIPGQVAPGPRVPTGIHQVLQRPGGLLYQP